MNEKQLNEIIYEGLNRFYESVKIDKVFTLEDIEKSNERIKKRNKDFLDSLEKELPK